MNYIPFNHTASATLRREVHTECINTINAAAGLTLTLPASSGSGDTYEFFVGTTVTSNSVIVRVANATDVMSGMAISAADGGSTVNGWETAATDDTITFNGSTTGGLLGDYVRLQDVASGRWNVMVMSASTGTEATPFSATVA